MSRGVKGAFGVAIAGATLLGGCASGEDAVPADAEPASVAAALIAAREDGETDPAQIEVLEIALGAERYPSDTEYRIAYEVALQCMRDSGIANVRMDEYWNAGLLDLGVSYSATLDEESSAGATVATCERVHVAYIAQARASEELIRGAQETIKREFLPAMVACLAGRGYPIDDDADFLEAAAADQAANEAEGSDTGCMESTGYFEAMTGPPAD